MDIELIKKLEYEYGIAEYQYDEYKNDPESQAFYSGKMNGLNEAIKLAKERG
jgi:hypothetical protein